MDEREVTKQHQLGVARCEGRDLNKGAGQNSRESWNNSLLPPLHIKRLGGQPLE
jgi:hypothetical protein